MPCLDDKTVQEIKIADCFLSGMDFGIFTYGYAIEKIQIGHLPLVYKIMKILSFESKNFESASFNNMSSLRSVEIENVKTSELLNLTFQNVPSLTSLKIEWYNFTLFPNKPFRELINLSELYITNGKLRVLPEDLFYNLHNLTELDLSSNNIESIHPLVFRILTKLEFLNLGDNGIKDLPSDMLKGLSNLRIFFIYDNKGLLQILSGFLKKLHNLIFFLSNELFHFFTRRRCNNEITCNQELQQFVSLCKPNIKLAERMFPRIVYTKCYGEERKLLGNSSYAVIGNYCPIKCKCSAEQNHVIVNCSDEIIVRIPNVLHPNATIVDLSNNYIKELSNIDCVTWRYVTHLRLSNNSLKFWKHWEKFSCPSKEHCPNSKNSSYIQIFSGFLLISCDNETADSRLTQCLDVKSVKSITFVNCYLSGIDLGKFNFGYEIERVRIMYTPYFRRRNFHSASFSNMSSLKSVEIQQVWTSELFNLTFHNVSSLTSLTIKINNIHLFPNRPFRELTNLSELSITNGNLKVLPADLFYNLGNLTKLVLSNNKIESIHSHTFRNLTRLESLYLEMNGINYLHSETLKGLSNLRTFSIDQNNRLSVIPTGLFKGLHNLTTFRALLCSISELDDDVFFDLINLQYINLDANQIEYLPPNLLKNNKLLTKFSCMDNKISALPSGIFRGLSHLFHVNLMGNRLKNLPKDIFANLSSLNTLVLSNNRLKLLLEDVFLPLTRLFQLDLSDNNLIKLSGKHPFGKSKDLDILRLYKAGLIEWPVVNWTEYNLTYIDFSDNHFETVKLPIYAANRMIIDLSDCKIRTIYIDEWKYGSEMPTFDLNKNKVTCDRKLRQFVFALKPNLNRTLKMFPDIKYIKCYGEKETVLEHISSVVPKEYCPTNCYCFAEKNEVTFNCSGKGINTIPQASIPNVTIVDLSNNYIKKLSKVDFAGWKNVTRLRLSNNSLSKFPDSVLPSRMKFLWLDGNRLTELPPALTNLIDASKEFKIYLSGNNWSCDCKTRFRRDWLLRNMHKIADFSKVSCKTTSRTLSFRKVVSGNYCGRTAKSVSGTKVSVIVLSVFIIIGLIILASIVYYKRRNITIEKSTSQEDGALSYNVYHQFK
ncbi:protein toll-like [Centruroides vittatus]|uniref:protein toll-like n=1 Tax=Centruroides vittatus TaxID=120091 RepID=UPI003510C5FE